MTIDLAVMEGVCLLLRSTSGPDKSETTLLTDAETKTKTQQNEITGGNTFPSPIVGTTDTMLSRFQLGFRRW